MKMVVIYYRILIRLYSNNPGYKNGYIFLVNVLKSLETIIICLFLGKKMVRKTIFNLNKSSFPFNIILY